MNKQELIGALSQKTGLTKALSKRALNAVIDSIAETLVQGGSVALPGFASFSVQKRVARTGRNPRTGEVINIAASKVVRFKMSAKLKDGVNG